MKLKLFLIRIIFSKICFRNYICDVVIFFN